ncbi:MAG: mannose-1-phosphate guanylyltransferase [Lachnospiraceae bacterium]|nr:mannose-1-phosphate guanylyltransferase [Lachnospiraceae bacterium]
MNVILLSGGSGRRLWPLSDDVRSKQFLPVFQRPDGAYESMVQRMYRQIKAVSPDARVTVATAGFQADLLKQQLGDDIGISVEPCRRDTFPAIALASLYLRDELGGGEEESVVVCPVDPYVEEDYFQMLLQLSRQAAKSEANLVLMGMEPDHPSELFGYVIPESTDPVSRVLSFKEKPDKKTAEEYISKGALWNGGVFAYRIGYVCERAKQITGYGTYREMFEHYEDLNKISFDYAVAEKEKLIEILRFKGGWKDLGTFDTLTEVLSENAIGKAVLDETCKNVNVINETDIPVLVMGLENVVVALSDKGLLVADKKRSSASKPYVDRIVEGQKQ